jgi:hypothetical protein
MSHQTQYNLRAAKIHAEVIIKNVRTRMEKLNVRAEVKQRMLSELKIEQLSVELLTIPDITYNNALFGSIQNIENRANAFFSAIDTYIVQNFDLEITDYQTAISQIGEFLMGSSDKVVSEALALTDDELLRTYILSESKETNYSDSQALIEAAKTKMQSSKLYKKAIKNTQRIFEKKGIIAEVSDYQNLSETIKKANHELNSGIVDKEVRNSVLTSIIKIIKEQGFIVKRENVEECGDHAKISAVKPNGEQVNFAVYLDGKFIYKFHEYEGLSCEKDINDFEDKFESIYGIKLEDKKTFWSNPDRIGKQGNQSMNKKEK